MEDTALPIDSIRPLTPLPTGSIRLLRLLPSDGADSYALEIFALAQAPDYEAISYCWGNEDASDSCICNEVQICLTPHLLAGLKSVFAVLKAQWLWVDVLSITQSDETEKAIQVAQMGNIFARAKRVVIWLGPHYEESDKVMKLMPILSNKEVISLLSADDIDWTKLISLGLPDHDNSFWLALFDILHRPYFERLWVVQEAVLANQIIVLCGDDTMSWQQVQVLSTALRDGDLVHDLGVRSASWRKNWKQRSFRSFTFIDSVDEVKTMRTERPWVAAFILLALIRKQIAKEPLDYVYGILGLLPDFCREQITVDYSEENRRQYGRTYTQLFKALFHGMSDAALMFQNNIETPLGAPSWCPHLKSGSQPGYTCFRVPEIGAGCNPLEEGYLTPCSPRIITRPDSNLIEIRGSIVDTVVQVIHLERPGKMWSFPFQFNDEAICRTCYSIFHCMAATRELGLSEIALASTLVGISFTTEIEKHKLLKTFEKTTSLFQSLTASEKYVDGLAVNLDLDLDVARYIKSTWSLWNGRSFFTTKEGRIGLGLRTTRPGDAVCIFFGAPKPYVLHPVKDSGTYQMIAECFVDGIMNGELFRTHPFKEDDIRDFQIV